MPYRLVSCQGGSLSGNDHISVNRGDNVSYRLVKSAMKDTRQVILSAARRQFAEKGFYGASIAAISDDVGVSKQALLHHFGTKEKLYGQVLKAISERFISEVIQASGGAGNPEERLEELLLNLHQNAQTSSEDTRLLMRELLDVRQRAETAQTWYLKPFLEAMIAVLKRVPAWRNASDAEALAAIYQILGAINYLAVSDATLSNMFGSDKLAELQRAYPDQLRTQIRHLITRA